MNSTNDDQFTEMADIVLPGLLQLRKEVNALAANMAAEAALRRAKGGDLDGVVFVKLPL